MSRKLVTLLLVMIAVGALVAASIMAEEGEKAAEKEEAKFEYVGDKKCKACHKDQHSSWLETTHAKAFDVLSDEEKQSPECVGCHTTGTTAKGVLLEGVSCEACHGPGSAYKSAKIMSKKKWAADPETHKKMAIEAGLIYPVEETCTRCHREEGNPNFKPFDFEKRKGEVHAFKEAEAEAKE
jgi:cytochrome c553